MTIRRRFLNVGVFLVAAGAVMLAAEAGAIDPQGTANALRLWPLAVVAVGIGLVLRRTRLDLPGGMVAAAMPGLLLGGIAVTLPSIGPVCGEVRQDGFAGRQGTFDGVATVELHLACGNLAVTTLPGSGWRLDTAAHPGVEPNVNASATALSVTSTERRRSFDALNGGEDWRLGLPTAAPIDLDAEVDAGRGSFDLAGARLGRFDLRVNAGDARVDLTGAVVSSLRVEVNAASASVRLPATGDLAANLTVNAGGLEVCAPADLGLRVRSSANLGSATFNGLIRAGEAWETPGYSIATYHADVTFSASVASVVVNPQGGCR